MLIHSTVITTRVLKTDSMLIHSTVITTRVLTMCQSQKYETTYFSRTALTSAANRDSQSLSRWTLLISWFTWLRVFVTKLTLIIGNTAPFGFLFQHIAILLLFSAFAPSRLTFQSTLWQIDSSGLSIVFNWWEYTPLTGCAGHVLSLTNSHFMIPF